MNLTKRDRGENTPCMGRDGGIGSKIASAGRGIEEAYVGPSCCPL